MPVRRHPVATSQTRDPLAAVPLDVALVARLRASYNLVRAHDLRLAEIFYAKLFNAAPHLKPLFRSDPAEQAQKLLASLDAVVQNLEHPAENTAMLAVLGKRHVGYGAKPEHYDLVIDMLIDAMRELADRDLDAAALEEWRTALRLISNQMIAAAGHAT